MSPFLKSLYLSAASASALSHYCVLWSPIFIKLPPSTCPLSHWDLGALHLHMPKPQVTCHGQPAASHYALKAIWKETISLGTRQTFKVWSLGCIILHLYEPPRSGRASSPSWELGRDAYCPGSVSPTQRPGTRCWTAVRSDRALWGSVLRAAIDCRPCHSLFLIGFFFFFFLVCSWASHCFLSQMFSLTLRAFCTLPSQHKKPAAFSTASYFQ